MSEPKHLFVYGILRRAFVNDHAKLLRAHCLFVGDGRFAGRLFDVGTYPAALADPERNSTVRGEVYQILRPSTLMPALDRLEGCGPSDPEPHLYRRETMEVELDRGRRLNAWVYLYNRSTEGLRPISHGDYVLHGNAGRKTRPK